MFKGKLGEETESRGYRDHIVFQKRFQNVFLPHKNEKPVFLKFLRFKSSVLSCSVWTVGPSVKALANEDTLLRTHCCRHKCFPVCPRAKHLLRTQILCPGHKKCFWFCSETFCVRNKCFPVCAAQETSWVTMFPQQCVLVYQGLKDKAALSIFFPVKCLLVIS